MDFDQIIILAVAAFFTSLISSLAGFGGGLLMIAAFSFFLDIKETIAISSLFFLASNTSKVWLYRKTVDWVFIKNILITGIPACIVGLYFFNILPERPIEIFLGLIGFYLIFEHFFPLPSLKKFTPPRIMAMGAFWGVCNGASNGMPIKVMMLKWYGLTKHMFVGTSATMSFLADLIKMVGYIFLGFLTLHDFWVWLPLFFAISFFGSHAGKWILGHTSIKGFETIMLVMMFLGSAKLLFF